MMIHFMCQVGYFEVSQVIIGRCEEEADGGSGDLCGNAAISAE